MIRNFFEKIFSTVGSFIIIFLVFACFFNQKTIINFDYIFGVAKFNMFEFGLTLMGLTAFGMVCIFQAILSGMHVSFKKELRKNEKKSIEKDEAQAKIKLLEDKIQTLETALDKALKEG